MINKRETLIPIFVLCCMSLLYVWAGFRVSTPYTYFTDLANQLLHGKLFLETNLPWLNELVPGGEGKWYVVYPPMPAVISLPFVMFGFSNQTGISILYGVLNIIILYVLARKLYPVTVALLLTAAFSLGTNHWFLASEGSAWYFSHVSAVFFLLLSLFVLNIRQRLNALATTHSPWLWFLSGLLLGAAYWSRLPTILAFPIFIYLALSQDLSKRKKAQIIVSFAVACALFILCNFAYNYIRFGTIHDAAYYKIPGVLEEPWYTRGIFSTSYLFRNLRFIFTKLPLSHTEFPFIKPSLEGMALWLTSPFLLLIPFIKRLKKWTLVFVVSGLGMIMPGLLHGTVGFSQFGYRFGLEGSLIMLLTLGTVCERKWGKFVFAMLTLAASLINLWGIYFIRFLDIWGW